MKIPGYCTECHRIKTVTMSSEGLLALALRRVGSGICDDCQDKLDKRRKR